MAIVRTEAYFNSSNGINKIRTLIWKDDELTPRGVFQIAHGMAEHTMSLLSILLLTDLLYAEMTI